MNSYEIEFVIDDSISPSEYGNKMVIDVEAEDMDEAEYAALDEVLKAHPNSNPSFWGGRLIRD